MHAQLWKKKTKAQFHFAKAAGDWKNDKELLNTALKDHSQKVLRAGHRINMVIKNLFCDSCQKRHQDFHDSYHSKALLAKSPKMLFCKKKTQQQKEEWGETSRVI